MVVRLLCGDVRDKLKTLPDESIDCCVTSPPYFGLRSYGDARQIGLEPTVDEYVAVMVEVFREVKRILRSDGTLWLNLGDSYNGSGGAGGDYSKGGLKEGQPKYPGRSISTLKPKDLIGIPWRVALALQSDGWYLRSEITWCKRSPMPESVTDRPTSATEKIFLLTKSARYYYDQEAVREPHTREWWTETVNDTAHVCLDRNDGGNRQGTGTPNGRNLWDYWLLSPEPFTGGHFATFPTEIPKRAILAGTSEKGCCPKCGKPWGRVIERTGHVNKREAAHAPNNCPTKTDSTTGWAPVAVATNQWQPTCKCGLAPVPCTVLDPFSGAGTTLMVADRLDRDAIGIELNAGYIEMAKARLELDAGMFAKVDVL